MVPPEALPFVWYALTGWWAGDTDWEHTCRCSFAALAQFYPKKYPDNIPMLQFCLVCYAICTVLLHATTSYLAGDSFFFASSLQV